uniref:Uncharacterized protein n=1 Tax=Anguilla anguilla TaxID=7936 RepID=A0A0E9Q133_ANGAN
MNTQTGSSNLYQLKYCTLPKIKVD